MTQPLKADLDFEELLKPETPLEAALISSPEFQIGYNWGTPRFGHPEGKVGLHVREVLDNVDKLQVTGPLRSKLRLVALIHDTFKYKEDKSAGLLHSVLAREFAEGFIIDQRLLDVIELHDEAYFIWRCANLFGNPAEARKRFEKLIDRMDGDLQLFYLFFKCDTETGDKIQSPLRWFEGVMENGMQF